MKQVLFHIPGLGVPVYGFGLMVVLAFYAALVVAAWRSRRERIDPALIYDLALWMLVGGLIGARLFYVTEYWGDKVKTIAQIFKIWEGGIVYYGGVLGGFAGLFAFRAVRQFPVAALLDVLAPAIALGSGIGRIGCFLNGCCYGDTCSIPLLGVRFPPDSPPWTAERLRGLIPPDAVSSLPLHPTQIYSALDGVILFLLLSAFFPLRKRDGQVMALFMMLYAITRFAVERLRDDESALALGMTISQLISVGMFTVGLAWWAYLSRHPGQRYVDIAPHPAAKPAPSLAD